MAAPEGPSKELQPIADLDRTIHSPARLMILSYLYVAQSADFVFLMRQTGLTRGNLSSHMSKLEAAGYIRVNKEFLDRKPLTLLQLTPRGRAAFRAYRHKMLRVLEDLPG
ncbi:MAG TPA: transcriptional regulator [Anaerolineae bacterium]|nr:transcriptional regulator [Anaerolineae bacterium]